MIQHWHLIGTIQVRTRSRKEDRNGSVDRAANCVDPWTDRLNQWSDHIIVKSLDIYLPTDHIIANPSLIPWTYTYRLTILSQILR